MRKNQREIKDFGEICGILSRCQTIRLAMYGEDYPYIVPLSFGYEADDGRITLYFHCAKEGKKVDLIRRDNRVCVEADILDGYVKTDKSVTADYTSFIGFGKAREVFGDDAVHGLELLLKHCGVEGYTARTCEMTGIVAVYAVELDGFTAKKRFI